MCIIQDPRRLHHKCAILNGVFWGQQGSHYSLHKAGSTKPVTWHPNAKKKQEKKETATGLNSPPRTQSMKSQQCRTLNGVTRTCHIHYPHAKLLNFTQETDREVHELGIQKGSQMGWHHMKMHKLLNTAKGSNVSYLNHICTGKFFF